MTTDERRRGSGGGGGARCGKLGRKFREWERDRDGDDCDCCIVCTADAAEAEDRQNLGDHGVIREKPPERAGKRRRPGRGGQTTRRSRARRPRPAAMCSSVALAAALLASFCQSGGHYKVPAQRLAGSSLCWLACMRGICPPILLLLQSLAPVRPQLPITHAPASPRRSLGERTAPRAAPVPARPRPPVPFLS